MSTPRLSVVLPLGDHRGLAVASVRAWVGQNLPAASYEVVAVDDRRERRHTPRVRETLRANDLFVVNARASEIELYQAGADAARGEILLFTESHAVPAPETGAALLRYLDRTGAPAATLRSAHIPRGALARLEALVGQVARAERPEARWWAGVSLRGFAVRHSLFRELGGFRTELERYAETALAIEMDRRGLRAEEVADALVHHGDCAGPGELEPALLGLGRGRRAYLEAGPVALVEPYVGGSDPRTRALIDSGLARELCTALAQSIVTAHGGRAWGADLAALLRWAPVALAGAAGASLPLRLRARLVFWWCAVPWGDADRHLARFRRAWSRVETCGEIEHLARRALPPPASPRDPLRFVPTEADDTDLVAFHYPEKDEGGSFRWTEPAALWRLALSPGHYRARLRFSPPPSDPRLRLYLNGRVVRPTIEPGSPGALTFSLPAAVLRATGEQRLVLLSAPFRPGDGGSTDGRTLGIAVRSLDLVRV
ncbi:MAG: hypothetical protein LJF30_03835 [Acidobacteria bacterium]|nr:hypothetical protein [Acidobacteriota bacterium]